MAKIAQFCEKIALKLHESVWMSVWKYLQWNSEPEYTQFGTQYVKMAEIVKLYDNCVKVCESVCESVRNFFLYKVQL